MSLSIRGNGVTGAFFLSANSKKLVNRVLRIPLSVVYQVQFFFLVVSPGIGQFQEAQSNSFATPLPRPRNPVPLRDSWLFCGRDIQEIVKTAKSLDTTATAT